MNEMETGFRLPREVQSLGHWKGRSKKEAKNKRRMNRLYKVVLTPLFPFLAERERQFGIYAQTQTEKQ